MNLLHGKLGPQFDALLFDNDGTLVSSMESVHRCWTRWAREYGITEEAFAAVELHGRPAVEIIADLLPEDVRAEALARIEVLETEDVAGGVVLLPGTKELLSALPAGRWAVVTSATRPLAEARLREVGIAAGKEGARSWWPPTTSPAASPTRSPSCWRPPGSGWTRHAARSSRTPPPAWPRAAPPG